MDWSGETPHYERGETPHYERGETPHYERGETPRLLWETSIDSPRITKLHLANAGLACLLGTKRPIRPPWSRCGVEKAVE